MDAYFYRADIFCKDCAKEIKVDLDSKGVEDTGDSGDYPQGPYSRGGGEADTPQHCGKCSVFLGNPLTTDGMQYVLEALDEGGRSGDPRVLKEWADFYGLEGPVTIKNGRRYYDGVRVAEIGSISTGTLRMEDLIPAGMNELFALDPEAAKAIDEEFQPWRDDKLSTDEDQVQGAWEAISEALEEHAPPNAHFGAHEGDGADIGFWW